MYKLGEFTVARIILVRTFSFACSGPVDYCWKVLPVSENNTDLACSHLSTVVECSFPIIYYFKNSGDFLLAIYVDNVVSARQRNLEIHIYDGNILSLIFISVHLFFNLQLLSV